MQVKINGKTTEMETGTTLAKLFESKNIAPEKVVVSVNKQIIQPVDYAQISIKDHDDIDLMTFVGGG
jgi:sulfur carrier protein